MVTWVNAISVVKRCISNGSSTSLQRVFFKLYTLSSPHATNKSDLTNCGMHSLLVGTWLENHHMINHTEQLKKEVDLGLTKTSTVTNIKIESE